MLFPIGCRHGGSERAGPAGAAVSQGGAHTRVGVAGAAAR